MKLYLNIKRNELSITKKDFFQRTVDANGNEKIEQLYKPYTYTNSNFKGYTKEDLIDLANQNRFGIFIKQRYSYLFELRTSKRDENGQVENKQVWSMTLNNTVLDSNEIQHLKTRKNFYACLDSQLEKHKVTSADARNIYLKVESIVPRLNDTELAQIKL